MCIAFPARVIAVAGVLTSFGTLIGCSGVRNSGIVVPETQLKQIMVAPQKTILAKGTTANLSATGVFSDGSKQDLTSSVAWTSSQAAIAAIDAHGVVTGTTVGNAQVSATYERVTGIASVTVGAAQLVSLVVIPNSSSLPIGDSTQFTATGTFSDGSTQNLTQSATWSSSASNIANVNATGMTMAYAVGTATVTASSGTINGSANVAVSPAAMVALTVSPASVSMVLESSRQLQAIASFSDGTTQDVTTSATWSSIDPTVVSVNNGGMTLAQQVGTATVQAQAGGFTGSAALIVQPLLALAYFDRARDVKAGYDGTIRLTNPGLTAGDLCAMVYVIDSNQELNECCGCSISDSGLRTISLVSDLTANPLTGKKPKAGTIMVVSSNPGSNGQCNAATPDPNGMIVGWDSNAVTLPDHTIQVTESEFKLTPMGNEATVLAGECSFLQQLGSGRGVCSCGSGN